MSTSLLLIVVAALVVVGIVVYWLIWISEGTYLGPWAVRGIYNLGARTYDQVKQYDALDEAAFLGNPLFSRLEESAGPHSMLLDVATGTARLPLSLLRIPFYEGEIVALDLSRGMLAEAARKLAPFAGRVTLLNHPSVPLPFDSETFDAVTCLEALEFMPDRRAALAEMVRVLRPGGWFVISNRIGSDARLMPGRTDPPAELERYLATLGLVDVATRPWQEYYDLLFAYKPGEGGPGVGFTGAWLGALRCPHCVQAGDGIVEPGAWRCAACGVVINIAADGVWEL